MMYLFKKLYKYVHINRRNNMSPSKKKNRDICKNIVEYVIYILILDDRLNVKELNTFQNNIMSLFDSCIDLLEDGKYLYKSYSFYDFIPYIHL